MKIFSHVSRKHSCRGVYAKKSQRDRSCSGACTLKLPPFKYILLQSELNINITFLCYGKHQQQDLAAHKKRKNVGLSPYTACSFFPWVPFKLTPCLQWVWNGRNSVSLEGELREQRASMHTWLFNRALIARKTKLSFHVGAVNYTFMPIYLTWLFKYSLPFPVLCKSSDLHFEYRQAIVISIYNFLIFFAIFVFPTFYTFF